MKVKSPWTGEEYEARIRVGKYANNHRLYVGIETFDSEFEFWEPYADITVNIDDQISGPDCGYLDVNNNPDVETFIVENGLGEPTYRIGYSGYCVYPEYRFNMNKLHDLHDAA